MGFFHDCYEVDVLVHPRMGRECLWMDGSWLRYFLCFVWGENMFPSAPRLGVRVEHCGWVLQRADIFLKFVWRCVQIKLDWWWVQSSCFKAFFFWWWCVVAMRT